MTILDTIDNAVVDWETSPDAMRWTPDAPASPPVPSVRGVAEMADALGFTLTEWQQVVLERQARMAADFDRARVCMTAVASHFREAMKGIGAALRPLLDEGLWADAGRPARIRQVRRDYRAKRRHW